MCLLPPPAFFALLNDNKNTNHRKRGGVVIKISPKEKLIKSKYFQLAKSADIFHEDRRNRMTITSHFVKNSDRFIEAEF